MATAKSILGRFGLELSASQGVRTTMWGCLQHLRDKGFRPAIVVDVGVASGTYDLYNSYPKAIHVLIEPLQEFNTAIAEIARKFEVRHIPAAAGAKDGHVDIWVKPHTSGSSVFAEKRDGAVLGSQRRVQVVTLDSILQKEGLRGPLLLKLDAEGAELDILSGAQETLKQT